MGETQAANIKQQGAGDASAAGWLEVDRVHQGDAPTMLARIKPESIACSVWSPPYHLGKGYEAGQTFPEWQDLLRTTIEAHFRILKPGGFLVVNIADILCFPDASLPRIQLPNVTKQRRLITHEAVLKAQKENPSFNRYQLAALLGCSEQTIDRRLNGNNIRGGKYSVQTRVQLVGHYLQEYGQGAGLPLYDRRIWVKDAAWENSQWHSSSYRAVDEFEYLYFFWKPGQTVIDRARLQPGEWAAWGSRAVWTFPSVRRNDKHEAKFPLELPSRVIRLLTDPGDTVLDCFMGSGTTATAAIKWGRHFIGIELLEDYVALSRQNIANAVEENRLLFATAPGPEAAKAPGPEERGRSDASMDLFPGVSRSLFSRESSTGSSPYRPSRETEGRGAAADSQDCFRAEGRSG